MILAPHKPKLPDLVAVLKCPPKGDVEVGDVGTVIELLLPDGIEMGIERTVRSPNTKR